MPRNLGAAIGAFISSVASVAAAEGGPVNHATARDQLKVEHAEIMLRTPGSAIAEGYLTIWNGTNTTKNLASVQSKAFADVFFVSADPRSGRAERLDGIVVIPPHAELLMRRDGVRLLFQQPNRLIDAPGTAYLTLTFDGGTELEIPAEIISCGQNLTDHHHGEGDRTHRGIPG